MGPHRTATFARPAGGKGAFEQAIGVSRGGRTSKPCALSDAKGRPHVLMVTPGDINDMLVAETLFAAAGPFSQLVADRSYDTNRVRKLIAARGAVAVIPSADLLPDFPPAYR